MAILFPDTAGQATDGSFTHTDNGLTWSWNGSSWQSTGSGSGGGGGGGSSYTDENAQDAASELFTNGSHSGISFSYNDATNTIDATAGGGAGRGTATQTTTTIADGVSADITIAAAKSFSLLKIQTSHAAWVTLYTDTASRTADASRTITTDPLPGSGVLAEIITSDGATQIITPGTIGWNNDSTPSTNIYAKVVNKSGSAAAIDVTLTYVQLEV